MRLKTLPPSHLDKLVRANQPVYVINTSVMPSGDKGMIVVTFYDGTQRTHFRMPPTFIPMAVTDSIPADKLLGSPDFKQSLLKGMLTLVEPSTAQAYLDTTDAQDEYEALVLSEHSAMARHIDVEREFTKRAKIARVSASGEGPVQDVSAVDTVSNKVHALMESLISGVIKPKEALVQLRRHQSALVAVDFSYVVANSTDPELTKWAKKALSRAAADDEDDDYEALAAPKKKKKAAAKKKPAIKKAKKQPAGDFDFKEGDEEMTAEERQADAAARQAAMASQATGGQSRIQDEINALINGA